jgi:predicted O-linked N-acetylglucosamine transferase (SPINDLY family)
VVAQQSGHPADAVQLIERAILLQPRSATFHANLGEALVATGELPRAQSSFRTALALDPHHAQAHNGLGLILARLGKPAEAVTHYRAALATRSELAGVWANLAVALLSQNKSAEAEEACRAALARDPNDVNAHVNLGAVLHQRHRNDEAVAELRRAAALAPGHADAYLNLGGALRALGRIDEAVAAYRTGLSVSPGDAQAHSSLLMTMHYASDAVRARQAMLDEHLAWARRHADPLAGASVVAPGNDRSADRRLRIGYLSGDFALHPVAFFIEPVLVAHDRAAVQVFRYSNAARPDDDTARLRRRADHWRDVVGLGDDALAQRVREDAIDVLIDLAGHTAANRLRALARRPAPVQATYLGYPDTTGTSAIDYRITDEIADPQGADPFYTERLLRLPRCAWCYRPPDLSPHPNALPAKTTGVVNFGSFNALAKVSPETVGLWSRVLHAVPKARLMIKSAPLAEDSARQRVTDAFAAHGVAADRLILRGRDESMKHHLRTYHEVDVALDPFPYHGTTTTCDALWMGVPVISLAGEAHVSRVGASLLHALGLDAMVAWSPDDYVDIARRVAADAPALAKLRATLRERMKKSPLTDAQDMSRTLEDAYRHMWRSWISSQ